MIITTEGPGGFEIIERLAIVAAQCAFDPRVFDDVFAAVHEIVEHRSGSVEKTMQDGVDLVLEELKEKALALAADAVIAVTIQYTPVGYGSSNRTLISGLGTAVRFRA